MLAGIQNPCPVGERDINALLPKRRAELGRKLIQHGLDGRIGEMTKYAWTASPVNRATGSRSEPTVPSSRGQA
jgi:hypothetical protein